jgi:hypothetical protein
LANLPVVRNASSHPASHNGSNRPSRVASPLKRAILTGNTFLSTEATGFESKASKATSQAKEPSVISYSSSNKEQLFDSSFSVKDLEKKGEPKKITIPHAHLQWNHMHRHRYDFIEFSPLGQSRRTGAASKESTLLCRPQHDELSFKAKVGDIGSLYLINRYVFLHYSFKAKKGGQLNQKPKILLMPAHYVLIPMLNCRPRLRKILSHPEISKKR